MQHSATQRSGVFGACGTEFVAIADTGSLAGGMVVVRPETVYRQPDGLQEPH